MSREDIYKDIKETLGGVGGFFDKMDDATLETVWETTKKTFLSDMSLGLKVNAMVALGAAYGMGCEYWIEFHTQTARLAGATDQNLEDVKTLAEFSAQFRAFLKSVFYDFDTWKKEVTAAHQFIAKKMGG